MNSINFKKLISTFMVAVIIFTMLPISIFASESSTPVTDKVINILHTNDSHGRVFSDASNNGMIGIDKIAAIHKSTANSILVDAGDTIHDLPIANTTEGSNVIELMTLAGYDVMTPGNHDFNYGSKKLADYAKANTTGFNIISSNIVYKKNQTPYLKSATIKTVDGVKVGFIGLTTTETPTVTNPVFVEDLEFKAYLQSAQKAIGVLKALKADVIVCLAHVSRAETKALAAELKDDVSVIIDGHDHLNTNETVSGVLIASSGQYEENLGKVTLTLDSNKKVVSKAASLITKADTANVIPDAAVNTRATEMMKAVNSLFDQNIGTSEVLLSSTRGSVSNGVITKGVRNSEMPLGNLVADAMRTGANADIAITNGGGLRADIKKGDISRGSVNAILPFGNYIVVKEVTLKQLKTILENGVANAPNPVGAFPQISGMRFEYNPGAPAGSRITKIIIGNKTLDLNDSKTKYKLSTNDYLANGGDGYTIIKTLKTLSEGNSLDLVLENYVKGLPNAKITADTAKVDGRIKEVTGSVH